MATAKKPRVKGTSLVKIVNKSTPRPGAPRAKTSLVKTVNKSTVTPRAKKPLGEKPAAGSDAYAKKKYGKNAWNNGMTN